MRDLLNLDRLTEVVDIGANPIDGDPPNRVIQQQKLAVI